MKLYAKFFSLHLRSMMQYKSSFFLMTVGQFILAFSAFVSVWFLFDRFHQVDGFTFPQVLLCFSVTLMAFSLCEGFFRGSDNVARKSPVEPGIAGPQPDQLVCSGWGLKAAPEPFNHDR